MEKERSEQPDVIRDAQGRRVAEIGHAGGLLHGACRWYDRNGDVLAAGWFVQGEPFAGTVLNWSLFRAPHAGSGPFDRDFYSRDWITVFEASFDSVPPDYGLILETYLRGRKI